MSEANDAQRDWMLGVLAVDLGLASGEAVLGALRAWEPGGASSLGRLLEDSGALTAEARAQLERRLGERLDETLGPDATVASSDVALGSAATVSLAADASALTQFPADFPPHERHLDGAGGPADRFRVGGLVAEGGLGQVYVAHDEELNRDVALKVIRPRFAGDRRCRARFLLEGEITAALEHPGVVPVHGLGLLPDGRPFYAMRLVRGEPLRDAIRRFHKAGGPAADARDGWPELRKLLRRLIDVCNVVAYAHSRGVLHRDLKPANILLGPYGETLLVDWGLAKPMGRPGAKPEADPADAADLDEPPCRPGDEPTAPGSALGTPQYMSPEQAEGRAEGVGPATDVYGLGATLYAVLAGRPPFEAGGLTAMLAAVRAGRLTPPGQVDRRVPKALEAVCLKAMALRPADRYASPRALADDLERWLADEPVSVMGEPISARLTRWGRRHRTASVSLGALLVAAVVGLSIGNFLLGRANDRTEQQRRRAEDAAKDLEERLYIHRINLAQRECLGNDVTRAEEILAQCPPALRGWEWSYVGRLCHGEWRTFRGHDQCVNAVAYSPDGTRVASGAGKPFNTAREGDAAELIVADAANGAVLRRIGGLKGSVHSVAFSPDGGRLAVGSGYYDDRHPGAGRLTVWDVDGGRLLLDRPHPRLNVLDVAFAPDGRRVAAAVGQYSSTTLKNHVMIWDLDSPCDDPAVDVETAPGGANALAFAPGGGELAVAGTGPVALLDPADGRTLRELRGHASWVYAVAYSPDGRRIATGGWDRTLRLWDRATGAEHRRVEAHRGHVLAVAFSPDGARIATAGDDSTVKTWDAEGEPSATLRGHAHLKSGARDVAFHPDGRRLATAGGDATVKFWDLEALRPITRRDHAGWTTAVAFGPEGAVLASASGDGSIALRDPSTGERRRTLTGHAGWVMSVAVSPDGRRVASGGTLGDLKLWDAATGRETWGVNDHANYVQSVAFSPDGRWLASTSYLTTSRSAGGEVIVWDLAAPTPRRLARWDVPRAYQLAFSPDGHRLAVACASESEADAEAGTGEVRVFEAPDGHPVRTLRGHKGDVFAVAFHPDGDRLATAGKDRVIRLWDPADGRVVDELAGHTEDVQSLAFSPDGRLLASGGFDTRIRLWKVDAGEELLALDGHDGGVVCLAFSPDGHRLASGSVDRSVKLWED